MKLPKIKNIFGKFFLTVLLLISLAIPTINSKANLPSRIVTKLENPIEPTSNQKIELYFHYGNPNLDKNLDKIQIKLEVKGSGLRLIPSSVKDLYFNQNEENQDRPKIPTCSDSYEGNEYSIDTKFINNNILLYGPQTSKTTSQAGGEESTTLTKKHTGCIKIELAVENDAKSGDLIEVIFNQNAQNSQSYEINQRPPLQIVKLRLASKADEESCEDGKEYVLNSCRFECNQNETRNIDGSCQVLENKCDGEFEFFGNECVPKCPSDKTRKGDGTCIDPSQLDNCKDGSCVNKVNPEKEICEDGTICNEESQNQSLPQLLGMSASIILIISGVVYIFIRKKAEE